MGTKFSSIQDEDTSSVIQYVGLPLDLLEKFPTGGQFYRNAS